MNTTIRLRVLPALLPTDGREIEMQATPTFIQWRYVSDHNGDYEWQNLVAVADLIGPEGPEIELRSDGVNIQYRVVGAADWINVIPLADITGAQGLTGDKGDKGDKGDQGDQGPPGPGDMVGPASAYDDEPVHFSGTSGKLVRGQAPAATFVFEGDSITYGYATPNPATDSWPAQFATMSFARRALGVFNIGATGTYVATIAARYAASVKPHRPTANGGSGGARSYLFLMVGINDLIAGTAYTTVIAAIKSYVDTALADGFTVVLSTILPVTAALAGGYEDDRTFVNSYIRDGYFGTQHVFDGAAVLSRSTDGLLYQVDGVHPTKAGYTLYAQQMNARLVSGLFPVDAGRLNTEQAIDAALNNAVFMASNASAFSAGSSFTNWTTPTVNIRSCFAPVAGTFTAEKAGTLIISALAINQNAAVQGKIQFRKNGTIFGPQAFANTALGSLVLPNVAIPLVRGDVVDLRVTDGATFAVALNTSISGFMIG